MALHKSHFLWQVKIEAHRVADRYDVPADLVEIGGPSAAYACDRVVKWALADAGAPPWRPYTRESMRHVKVRRVIRTPGKG